MEKISGQKERVMRSIRYLTENLKVSVYADEQVGSSEGLRGVIILPDSTQSDSKYPALVRNRDTTGESQ